MKRLFTMGLALLMVLTMVPMSCHASNLDAGIGAESVMLASMTVSAVAVDSRWIWVIIRTQARTGVL